VQIVEADDRVIAHDRDDIGDFGCLFNVARSDERGRLIPGRTNRIDQVSPSADVYTLERLVKKQ
jgi:hypothetical protein